MKRFISVLLLLISVYSLVGMYSVSCSDDNLAEVFRVLKENGLSDIAAAAIVGNAAAESGGSPSCVEAGEKGKGIGIFQQSLNFNRQALEDYCSTSEHSSCPKVTLSPASASKSYVVCNVIECQVLATLQEFEDTMNGRSWSKNYNKQVGSLSVLANAVASGTLPREVSITNSWDGFIHQNDLFAATLQFMCDYETPGSSRCMWVGINSYSKSTDAQNEFISSLILRYEKAVETYEKYATVETASISQQVRKELGVRAELPSYDMIAKTREMIAKRNAIESQQVAVEDAVRVNNVFEGVTIFLIIMSLFVIGFCAWFVVEIRRMSIQFMRD